MDLVDIAYQYDEISKISLAPLKRLRPTKTVARRAAAGGLAATMLAGGGGAAGLGAVKGYQAARPAIARAIDDARYSAHSVVSGGQTGAPGHLRLSREDWVAAGRPGTAFGGGASQWNPPKPGQARRTPLYETGNKSGVWTVNRFGNRELQPLKDIKPGSITAANGDVWRY